MDELTKTIASRGDLAHLALFLWASGASALLVWTLRELSVANKRFEDFVKEIAALNQLFKRRLTMTNQKNEAVEVFRQFAWNLAGSLAAPSRRALATRPVQKSKGRH